MSGTASPRPDRGVGEALFGIWVLVILAGTAALLLFPADELFAVEAVLLAFAVLYGFGRWPTGWTVAAMVAFAVAAGYAMYPRVVAGTIPPAQLVEVVAPLTVGAVVIYHVRRRDEALRRVELLAEGNRRRAAARERLGRMTSHELRTPLTIATGYVDQLLEGEPDGPRRDDLDTVREELTRIARVSERLIRAVALDLGAPEEPTDLTVLLEDVRRRWEVVVDRDFVVTVGVGTAPVNADRLRAALDTLVENSVRYTAAGDRIRLYSLRAGTDVEIGVDDAGSGLTTAMVAHINEAVGDAQDVEALGPAGRLRDMYSQTGFGLRIVAGIARSAGGRLVASTSDDGGARIALAIPADG